jgi:hypothetical protein
MKTSTAVMNFPTPIISTPFPSAEKVAVESGPGISLRQPCGYHGGHS